MILIKTYLNAALEGRRVTTLTLRKRRGNQISSPLAGEDKGEGDKIGGRQDTLTPLLAGQAPTFTPPRRGSPVREREMAAKKSSQENKKMPDSSTSPAAAGLV